MDDLKLIDGIGPATEKKLHQAGIDSFAKLAAATPDTLNTAQIAGGPDDWAKFIEAAGKRVPPQATGTASAAATPVVASQVTTPDPAIAANAALAEDVDRLCAEFGIPRSEFLFLARTVLDEAKARKEAEASTAAVVDADRPVLEADRDVPAADLLKVTVTGPSAGRYRAGHHFTGTAQALLVSPATRDKLKADPVLIVADA